MTLAENLKNYRIAHGLTQQQVADMIEKDRSSIAKYENGKAVPPLNILNLFAKLYSVSVDMLCGSKAPSDVIVFKNSDDGDSVSFTSLSENEKMMILKYRLLDDDKKKSFTGLLDPK